jgi:glutamate synthase (NADPH/NADH) small chain
MAAAQQLARAGHEVHVYEREIRAGGLLRYGIPDFKMEKNFIDRRVDQMEGEGVTFHYGVNVGVDKPVESCRPSTTRCFIAAAPRRRAIRPASGRDLQRRA